MHTGRFEIFFDIGIIVYVEMALRWNRISGVHSLSSPSQFMPFFIALAQLLNTLYRLGKAGLKIASTDNDDSEFEHGKSNVLAGML